MVLAAWLIVKGFNPLPAQRAPPAKGGCDGRTLSSKEEWRVSAED